MHPASAPSKLLHSSQVFCNDARRATDRRSWSAARLQLLLSNTFVLIVEDDVASLGIVMVGCLQKPRNQNACCFKRLTRMTGVATIIDTDNNHYNNNQHTTVTLVISVPVSAYRGIRKQELGQLTLQPS